MPIQRRKFRRDDHVYVNSQFSELLKDAVRFFHGTPVQPLPPEEPFKGAGVYAIYCISKKGLYKTFGEKINRTSYDVPIYVGKAVPEIGIRSRSSRFSELSCVGQLMFWHKAIKTAIGMTVDDFRYRICTCDDFGSKRVVGVYRVLRNYFHPVWNRVFDSCNTSEDILGRWNKIHSIRFCNKADEVEQDSLKRMLEAV